MMTVTVLGDGAWGSAFATLLATHGYRVILWCFNKSVAEAIEKTRVNSIYLPGISLSPLIQPTVSLEYALSQSDWIFEAIPVQFLRSVCQEIKHFIKPKHKLIILSKGIESNSLLLPSQIIEQLLGAHQPLFVLSGPSFALELAHQQPTAVNIASTYAQQADLLKKLLDNNYFTTCILDELIGIQAAGAFKNCIAIATGMLAGMGYSANTQAVAITRGLHEIAQLIHVLGGNQKTAYTLAGIGDLVLTALSATSKNYKLGFALGQQKKLADLHEQFPILPEGINTLISVEQLVSQHELNLPICSALCTIIFKHAPVRGLLRALDFE